MAELSAADRKRDELRHDLNERDGVDMGLRRRLERLRRRIFVPSMGKSTVCSGRVVT